MISIPGELAYKQLMTNIRNGTARMPTKSDSIQYDGITFIPKISPKFTISPGQKIFAMGSCFVRHVENGFNMRGYVVPTANFVLPGGELRFPAPHALNEYNAGTMIQRLENALGVFSYLPEMGVEEVPGKGYIDLFLHRDMEPVSIERLHQRRVEIEALYKEVLTSDLVVITLGLVECWYDSKVNCYLNSAPSSKTVRAEPERFFFHRMDIDDVLPRLRKIVELLNGKNVLFTVSPIPTEATFTEDNAILSNSYSKAVLRVCADLLSKQFSNVGYFPSFEMASSGGTTIFESDHVHIHHNMVEKIMKHMMEVYQI